MKVAQNPLGAINPQKCNMDLPRGTVITTAAKKNERGHRA